MKNVSDIRIAALLLTSVLTGCDGREPSATAPEPDAAPTVQDAAPLIGNSMPGTWRPFHDFSPWNQPIPAFAVTHAESPQIMATMTRTANTRFGNKYLPPFWVVERYDNMQKHFFRSSKIFDPWDCCPRDSVSDIPLPVVGFMYDEPTTDGHIIIYDRQYERFFECSYFDWLEGEEPAGTTFNIWKADGFGAGGPWGWDRWQLQGGRGSGVPIVAGLLRPEELEVGEIRHALAFTFADTRMGDNGENIFMLPPACRSDGKSIGDQYPIEGMRFQLDPLLGDAEFDAWGLDSPARVIARALQVYGAILVDRGGDWAFQVQLLGPTSEANRARWDALFPTLYNSVTNIPTSAFRVVYAGELTVVME